MFLRSITAMIMLLSWVGVLQAAGNQFPGGQNPVASVMNRYLQELEGLEASLPEDNFQHEIRVVRAEKDRVEKEIRELDSIDRLRQPKARIEQLTVRKKHDPKTYMSNAPGIAGAPDFTKNNVYTFILDEVGSESELTFYASGRKSTDSYGKVWLVTPGNERHRIYKWSPRDFKRPISEASSYERLSPVNCDISDYVEKPGVYKIEFEYTDGIDALGIMRVELTT